MLCGEEEKIELRVFFTSIEQFLPQVYGWGHLKTQLAALRLAELEENLPVDCRGGEIYRVYELL